MKKIHIIFTLLIASLLVLSCSTDYNDIKSDHSNNIIGFSTSNVLELTLSENSPEINFPTRYFVTSVSSSERTFRLIVVAEETEVLAASYSFDANVVVPANEREGTIIVTLLNNSLTNEYQTLVLAFEGSSEILSGNRMNFLLKTSD